MEHQIDVKLGREPSLWDDKSYRELGYAMGNELLAGAFVSPPNVREAWSTFISPHTIAGYAPESKSWGELEKHTAAIVGYKVNIEEGKEYTVIALHYAEPDGAARNADEFGLRLNTAQIHFYGTQESFHSPLFSEYCEQLDLRADRYSEFSVLVAECRAYGEDEYIYTRFMSNRSLWSSILSSHSLHFLIPDINNLGNFFRVNGVD